MKGTIKKLKTSDGSYIFPVSVSDSVYVDPGTTLKEELKSLHQTMGKGPGSYVIDLARWGLNNAPTDLGDKEMAHNNSIGINAAIRWAADEEYSEIILPKGTYLVDEQDPIIPQSHLTLNLGGSTLRIRNNNLQGYNIININQDQEYLRITNGKVEGDRYDHDYSSGGTHEGGYGVHVANNCRFILMDFLEIFNCTGDSAALSMSPNFQAGTGSWEQGNINLNNGTLVNDSSTIRLTNRIDLSAIGAIAKYGYFGFYGNGWGDLGGDIHSDTLDVVFYNSADAFVSSINNVNFFDDITVPEGVTYARVVLHQSNVPGPSGSVISIGVGLYGKMIYLEKCHIHHSRRCGISGGGRHVYIHHNLIHDIQGTAPQCIIDVEDGYGLNQDFHFTNNRCYNAKIGLSFVSTKNVVISDNFLDRIGLSTIWGECKNVVLDSNIIYRSSLDVQGEALVSNNSCYRSEMMLRHSGESVVEGGYFHNSSLSLTKDAPYRSSASNCKFYSDLDSLSSGGCNLWLGHQPVTLTDITIESHGEADVIGIDSNAAYGYDVTNLKLINTSGSGFRLPPGIYKGCTFDNSGGLGLVSGYNNSYEFIGCEFKNFSDFLFWSSYNTDITLRLKENTFYGTNTSVFYARDYGGLEVVGNLFIYEGATDVFNIFDFFADNITFNKPVIFDNNRFVSDTGLNAVNLNRQAITNEVIFRNNILENVKQPMSMDRILFNNNIIDGIYEPLRKVTSLPTTGWHNLGSMFYHAVPVPGGTLGWICITEGLSCANTWKPATGYSTYRNVSDRIAVNSYIYEATTNERSGSTIPNFTGTPGEKVMDISPLPKTWSANTAYAVGDLVIPTDSGHYYYKCTIAGTSGMVEPKWSEGTGKPVTDGTVTWMEHHVQVWIEIAAEAKFKEFGSISS